MKPTVRSLAKYRGHECLNCETPLDMADKFCHQCGQLNTTKRLALKDFFSEFFANFISYDSRVWRTINHLLIKPGKVTLDYCAGKRSQYTNPFRFFLTVSIVFFLLLQVALQLSNTSHIKINPKDANGSMFNVSLDSTTTDKKSLIKKIKQQQDSLAPTQNKFEKIVMESAIAEMEKDTITPITMGTNYLSQKEIDDSNFIVNYFEQVSEYGDYQKTHPDLTTQEALQSMKHRIENTNISRYEKAKKLNNYTKNPIEMINLILPKIPLFLFFFAPAISLFFWLIYARGKWNYMEHMVFNFHLLTFVFLMLYLIIAEKSLFDTGFIAGLFFFIIGPIYLYKAMRKFYNQGRFKTILKFLFINFVFFVLLFISSTLFMASSIYLSV